VTAVGGHHKSFKEEDGQTGNEGQTIANIQRMGGKKGQQSHWD